MAILFSVLGGLAFVGLFMLVLATVSLVNGVGTGGPFIFILFIVGCIVSYLVLQSTIKKLQKDALKKFGLDK